MLQENKIKSLNLVYSFNSVVFNDHKTGKHITAEGKVKIKFRVNAVVYNRDGSISLYPNGEEGVNLQSITFLKIETYPKIKITADIEEDILVKLNFFDNDIPEWCIKKWYEKYYTHYECIDRDDEDDFCAKMQLSDFVTIKELKIKHPSTNEILTASFRSHVIYIANCVRLSEYDQLIKVDIGEETVIFGYHRITDINILSSNGKKVRVTMCLMDALYFNVTLLNRLANYCVEKWKRKRPFETITEVEEELYRKRLRIIQNYKKEN